VAPQTVIASTSTTPVVCDDITMVMKPVTLVSRVPRLKAGNMQKAASVAILFLLTGTACRSSQPEGAQSIPLPEEVVAFYDEVAAYRPTRDNVRLDLTHILQKSNVEYAVLTPYDAENWYEPSRRRIDGTTITTDVTPGRDLLVILDLGDIARNNYHVLTQLSAVKGSLDAGLRPRICTQILCGNDRFDARRLPERIPAMSDTRLDFGRVLPDGPVGSIGRPGTICEKCLDIGRSGNVIPCLVWQCGKTNWPVKRKVHVRRNVYNLGSTEIASLRAGVAAMKARPATDPTSWLYQAKIHAVDVGAIGALQDQCQHRQFFFFSWHRMFIYFFERILRSASGDPNLTLPYWNYTDDPSQGVLPEPFRLPADATNSLYNATRSNVYNAGAALPPADVSYSAGFSLLNFTTPTLGTPSFGGRTVAGPAHFPATGGTGRIEQSPHNNVHNDVSGEMATGESPRDPIFWLHHANIDRLWKKWIALGGGRENPTADSTWMTQTFTFFNETGAQIPMTGAQILDTVAQLNYRYDDDPLVLWPSFWPSSVAAFKAAESQKPVPLETLGTSSRVVRLTDARQEIPLNLPEPARTSLAVSRKTGFANERIILQLRNIQYDQPVGVTYLLFLNLPPDVKNADHKHPAFIGTLGFFGKTTDGAATEGLTEDYDVTEVIQRLGSLDLRLTVLPSRPIAPEGRRDIQKLIDELKPKGNPRFGEIVLLRQRIE
jgi:tyrosinase-like protein/polyphenol oxidase-like protein